MRSYAFFGYLALLALGLAGNHFSFPVFLDIHFIFGSIFALLALQFFGLGLGIVAAALIASSTYFLWNEGYALIIMTAEVALVGWMMARLRMSLVFADTVYWLLVGMPLGYLFYHSLNHLQLSSATMIMTKQAINGISNALLARLIFHGIALRSKSLTMSFREIVYNMMALFVLLPSLILLAVGSRADFNEIDQHIRSSLIQDSVHLQDQLQRWVAGRKQSIVTVAELATSRSAAQMQLHVEQAKNADLNFLRVGLLNRDAVTTAYFPALDELGQSNIGRDFSDRPHAREMKRMPKPMMSEVVLARMGAPAPVVIMLAPVMVSGSYRGYATGVLSLMQVQAFIDKSVSRSAMLFTLLDRNGKVIMSTRADQKLMQPFARGPGVSNRLDAGIAQWLPALEANTPILERWKNSFYVTNTEVDELSGWTLILEQPVAPFQQALFERYARKLALLFLVLLSALALAEWLSRRSIRTLKVLSLLTQDLPNRLAADPHVVVWPSSHVVETKHLIDNFRRMGESLTSQLQQVHQANESLERRVQERSAVLMQSEERLRTVIEQTREAIAIHRHGRVIFANPAAVALVGAASAQELIGQAILNFVHPDYRELVAARVKAVARSKSANSMMQEKFLKLDGSVIDVEVQNTWIEYDGEPAVQVAMRDVTERTRAEAEIRATKDRLQATLDALPDLLFEVGTDGRIYHYHSRRTDLLAAPPEAFLDKKFSDFLPPEVTQVCQQALQEALDTGISTGKSYRLTLSTGEHWFELSAVPMRQDSQFERRVILIARDVSERKRAEESVQLAASVFTHAREGIMITDSDAAILEVNNTFTQITGYSRDEVVGRNPRLLSSGRQDGSFYAAMWRDLQSQGFWTGELWNCRKDGQHYAAMLTISAVRDTLGHVRQYVGLFSDITALKAYQQQLEYIAHYDSLTNLPNRVLLADRLHQAMAQAQRRMQSLAVVFLDLDGFKAVNDHHGHEAGDQLLITLASRMKASLREGDSLARFGGDEFVAVLLDLEDVASSLAMLDRLLAAAAQPVQVGDMLLQVSASMGVTFYPQSVDVDADHLLRQADQAMYQAKQAGKNRYHVFDSEHDRYVRGHLESLDRIRQALKTQEFVLYYQPKVNMRSGKIIGTEALIRWQHPQKGLLLPGEFLPAIEDHSLAVELGEWVIDAALRQCELWRAQGLDLPVSVNVGGRQLQQKNFVQRLRQLLAAHPTVAASCLELEVLETSALEDIAQVIHVIESCRDIGVAFSIDDFGTGYSSLTYLRRLPVSLLKIDQSFVRDMLDDPDDLTILQGVIGLAKAFRRKVIAEGVETAEHGSMLLQMGCELAQGYGIARPMPGADIPAWSLSWLPDPAWTQQPQISGADSGLLFASVEHRAWIKAMQRYLRDDCEQPPELSHSQCRFGIWLAGEGLAQYSGTPALAQLDELHQKIHVLAQQQHALKTQGQDSLALQQLTELDVLRDRLIELLQTLHQHQA